MYWYTQDEVNIKVFIRYIWVPLGIICYQIKYEDVGLQILVENQGLTLLVWKH
jgi:hypothetical protein